MKFENLTEENILIYAIKHYDNPASCGIHEFEDDYGRIKYVKRLLKRYQTKGVLKERLILNHIIILINVFGVEAGTRILFFRIEQDLWSILKTFLVFLSYQADVVFGIAGQDIISSDIVLDNHLVEVLRAI